MKRVSLDDGDVRKIFLRNKGAGSSQLCGVIIETNDCAANANQPGQRSQNPHGAAPQVKHPRAWGNAERGKKFGRRRLPYLGLQAEALHFVITTSEKIAACLFIRHLSLPHIVKQSIPECCPCCKIRRGPTSFGVKVKQTV
jgi:hypothetical protein